VDPHQLVNRCANKTGDVGLKAALHAQLYQQYACQAGGCA
jgi:hypothetical protein